MTHTTKELAKFVASTKADDLPANVRLDATRQFHNFVGCTLGGMTHDATVRTFKTVLPFTGGAKTSLIGRKEKLSAPDAVLINAQASAAHAFDDTHLSTVLHPAGPIAAPLMAEAEREIISGQNLRRIHHWGGGCMQNCDGSYRTSCGNTGWLVYVQCCNTHGRSRRFSKSFEI